MTPQQKGRRPLTALAVVGLITGIMFLGTPVAAITQSDFELDKNATGDLTTSHLGVTQTSLNTTDTSFKLCEYSPNYPSVPSSGTLLIDGEQMAFTKTSTVSNKVGGCTFADPSLTATQTRVYNIVRGQNGTTAATHPGDSDVTLLASGSVAGADWDQVYTLVTQDANDTGNDDKCIELGAVECSWVHDPIGASIFTTGGSKDDLDINTGTDPNITHNWMWTNSSVPNADEILDAFAIKYDHTSTGGHQFLYFGADRYATNGAKDFGFWFFKSPVSLNPDGTFNGQHSVGDILALGTFTQGGAVTTIRVYSWVGSGGDTNTVLSSEGAFGDCVPGSASDQGCNTVSDTTVPSPWAYQGSASTNVPGVIYTGGLMEGAMDLTALGLTGCFASFMAETRSSPSIGAQLKDFALGNFESCSTGLTTTPSDGASTPAPLTDSNNNDIPDISIGSGSVQVKDKAVLSVQGTSSFTGTLAFHICGPISVGTLCDTAGSGVAAGSSTVTANGTYYSSAVTLTSAGYYCWRGDFTSGTNGVPNGSDSSSGECFEVLPVDPTISTSATAAVEKGGTISDSATLGGTATRPGTNGGTIPGDAASVYKSINATNGAAAGGTITFNVYGPGDATCTGTAAFTATASVSGNGSYGSGTFTPTSTGTYRWIASYGGDSPNTNSKSGACNDANETSKVVDAKISITPTQTNEVGVPHTFTVTVKQDVGDGNGFVNAPDGTPVTVTLTDSNNAVNVVDNDGCASPGGTSSGTCTVVFHSDSTGKVTGHASVSLTILGLTVNRSTDGNASNSADAVKTYVDAKIAVTPLTATNEVNHAHTITATVSQDKGDGASWVAAPNGTTVTFSLLNNTAGAAFVGGLNTCTTTTGQCSVVINTTTAGSVDIHATTTFSVGGVSLTRSTGTGGNNSADANKVYVDAYITINPPEATNTVGDLHTFTVNVYQDDGRAAADPLGDGVDGWAPAPAGTTVDVTLTDDATSDYQISSDVCGSTGTVSGACTVVFTSPTAGTVTGHAEVTFLVGGQSLTRETDGTAPNSGDAIKHFIAGSISWTKVDNGGALQGGATFTVCKTATYDIGTATFTVLGTPECVDILDNDSNDSDKTNGEFEYVGLPLGRYTVVEKTAPAGFVKDPNTRTVELVPGDTEQTITVAFVNSRPILKITGFGYTNSATSPYTSGVFAGTAIYSVAIHNYGTASTTLSSSSLVVSSNATCTGGNTKALTGSIAAGGDLTFTLTCTYDHPSPTAITATLVVKYTTNSLERTASGSPATITFTVNPD